LEKLYFRTDCSNPPDLGRFTHRGGGIYKKLGCTCGAVVLAARNCYVMVAVGDVVGERSGPPTNLLLRAGRYLGLWIGWRVCVGEKVLKTLENAVLIGVWLILANWISTKVFLLFLLLFKAYFFLPKLFTGLGLHIPEPEQKNILFKNMIFTKVFLLFENPGVLFLHPTWWAAAAGGI